MEEGRNVVIVDSEVYERLVGDAAEYNLLINALLESADLNYNKKSLSFSETYVCNLLKAAAPGAYRARLNKLQSETMEGI